MVDVLRGVFDVVYVMSVACLDECLRDCETLRLTYPTWRLPHYCAYLGLQWLESNPEAEQEDVLAKHKEMETMANPIITRCD